MNFTLNCGTERLGAACTVKGAMANTSRLDSIKKTKDNAKNLSTEPIGNSTRI
jgi:hypothetical protein